MTLIVRSADDVPDFVAGNLLLIVQEAISNALRHGRPKTITVRVSDHPSTHSIRATVQDDGAGFPVGRQQGVEQGHFGLYGMRERAERLGGSLSVASEPGSGTTVSIEVRRRDYDRDLAEPAAADSPAHADSGVSSNDQPSISSVAQRDARRRPSGHAGGAGERALTQPRIQDRGPGRRRTVGPGALAAASP
jgi:hypothetical protein